jgi:hypothetical protein
MRTLTGHDHTGEGDTMILFNRHTRSGETVCQYGVEKPRTCRVKLSTSFGYAFNIVNIHGRYRNFTIYSAKAGPA